jgi:hypothetical protein
VEVAFLVEVGLVVEVLVGALTGAATTGVDLDSDETGAASLLELLEPQLFFWER